MTITLSNLRFFAYHGLYDEEKKIGTEFEVSVEVDFVPEVHVIDTLTDSINYVAVYEWVKKNMEIPTPLLETVVMRIATGLADQFPSICESRIALRKLSPPIAGMEGQVGVRYVWKR